jgi:uncharacterized damage-inducible protein DinB
MDRLETLRWLWDFQSWARPRVVAAASRLSMELLNARGTIAAGLGRGSVHDMLAHIVGAEEIWVRRWQGQGRARLPAGSDFQDLADIAERWERVETSRKEFLDASSDPDLDREVRYLSVTRRVEESFPLWQTILAIANHTTHHRADACTALSALGHPAESVDFIDYLRDGAARAPQ